MEKSTTLTLSFLLLKEIRRGRKKEREEMVACQPKTTEIKAHKESERYGRKRFQDKDKIEKLEGENV